ncbi:hypothetical protein HYS94_02110 [Candidatus Daviesbacteria bacterium]|nr:hypothetical protein [Candidatus Daviesbacteria bacterium]
MNLDRREKHVLNELRETYNIPVAQLLGKLNSKEASVIYAELKGDDSISCHVLSLDGFICGGVSSCSPNDKYSYAIGRMIAFADAAVNYSNNVVGRSKYHLTSKQLESIARGNTLSSNIIE